MILQSPLPNDSHPSINQNKPSFENKVFDFGNILRS